jgi:hypothetical protein
MAKTYINIFKSKVLRNFTKIGIFGLYVNKPSGNPVSTEQGDQIGRIYVFGWLFTLGSFFKITTVVAQNFVLLFPR